MFCVHCGKEIKDEAIFCPHCGVATHNFKAVAEPQAQPVRKQVNVIAIIGFSLSLAAIFLNFIHVGVFLLAIIAALVLSIVGAVNAKNCHSGTGFAVAGIVISAVTIISFLAMIFFAIAFALTFLPFFASIFI